MHSMMSLLRALAFIEQNRKSELSVADVAASAYLSASHLQRMFANVFHCSVGDYLTKRKLCAAARDLLATNATVTALALDYGYSGPEAFSRAFKRQFLKTPSAFRQENRFSELYPKFLLETNDEKGWNTMIHKYDLTEISRKILAVKGTYILNVDIDGMELINRTHGHDMGDVALAQTAARIEKSIDEKMDFFRIGGDAFVVLTNSDDFACAEAVAKKMIAFAGDEVGKDGKTFTFTLSVGIAKIPIDDDDAQTALAQSDAALMEAKLSGKNTYASK